MVSFYFNPLQRVIVLAERFQTMDEVYCEDFPFRGRDSIFRHATPSMLFLAEHRVVVLCALPSVPLPQGPRS